MPPLFDRELKIEIDVFQPGAFRVEMSFDDPNDVATGVTVVGIIKVSTDEIVTLKNLSDKDYGKALSQKLFNAEVPPGKESLASFFANKKGVSANGVLRIRVYIGANASLLNNLRWELLADPADNTCLSTNGKFLFSRFVVSSKWTPIKLRARSELTALVAVSNPTSYPGLDHPPVSIPKPDEIARAKTALAPLGAGRVRILGETDSPADRVSLKALTAAIREGVDIVYIVCHGSVKAGPELFLQNETDGACDFVSGLQLADAIRSLPEPPRLVVLASCESAGADGGSAESALAPLLADAGVPAIIAMQGKISINTATAFMPVFFTELLRTGSIDGSMTAARVAVAGEIDSWMPALFLRLKSGSIWYTPGFNAADQSQEDIWKTICSAVTANALFPIIGHDLAEHILGSSSDTAAALADANLIPRPQSEKPDGARIAQAVETKVGRQPLYDALNQISDTRIRAAAVRLNPALASSEDEQELLHGIVEALQNDPNDPLNILASLDVKVYISAANDLLLKNLLRKYEKVPYELCVDWRDETVNDFDRVQTEAVKLLSKFEQSPSADPESLINQWEEEIIKARPGPGAAPGTANPSASTETPNPLEIPISLRAIRDALLDRLDDNPGVTPLQVVREWNDYYLAPPGGKPSPALPKPPTFIYYAYGKKTYRDSLVLTENDFFDYLIRYSKFDLMPPMITSNLFLGCVLFLGFSLDDWKFRILFRTIMQKGGASLLNNKTFKHVGVQLDPDDYAPADAVRLKQNLEKYFNGSNINIYWGSSADFLRELKKRLAATPKKLRSAR